MATLNITPNGKAVKGRTKKPLPSVDLTAMVDLAFLLITFFMLTTSLAKFTAMDVIKPAPIIGPIAKTEWPESRTMTILLGKNNRVVHYMGEAKHAVFEVAELSKIKRYIIENKILVAGRYADEKNKHLLIIIKPMGTSNYRDFVDIIDEMSISDIKTYAIDDKYILPSEKEFMKAKGI